MNKIKVYYWETYLVDGYDIDSDNNDANYN